jgi:flagellar hook protein FlgE
MLQSLTTATSAIKNYQTSLDTIAGNLANLNTAGYKGARVDFAETMNQVLRSGTSDQSGVSGTAPMSVGTGMATSSARVNFSQGALAQTGSKTDFAISGKGYFLVRNNVTNEVFASRAGSFHLDANNYLCTDNGYRVQGISDSQKAATAIGDIQLNQGTVPNGSPASAANSSVSSINVDSSGRVNVLLDDGTQYVRGQMMLQSFNNEQSLTNVGNNLFSNLIQAGPNLSATSTFTSNPSSVLLNGALIPGDNGTGSIAQGSIENSNVDLSNEFSQMITTQRAFQANSKVISTSDEILQELIQLKR